MTSGRDPDPSPAEDLLAETLAAEPDFASEHQDMTVGDRDRGGPEHAPEPESPKGYGGADFHRPRPPKKPRGIIQVGAVMALAHPPGSAVASRRPGRKPGIGPNREPAVGPNLETDVQPELEPDISPDLEPALEPDFAMEHRHLNAGGADRYPGRRRNDDSRY